MLFTGSHSVTVDDYEHAVRLAARPRDMVLSLISVLVLVVMLFYVGWAFALYAWAVLKSPDRLIELMRFELGGGSGVLSWLSVLVSITLPVFLFFSLRALLESLLPARRVRRLMRRSDLLGPTTYRIDDEGVRSATAGGPETFLPWSSFDGLRSDSKMLVLTRHRLLRFFVPFAAFDENRESLVASIAAHVKGPNAAPVPSSDRAVGVD